MQSKCFDTLVKYLGELFTGELSNALLVCGTINFFECLQYALLASSIHTPLTSDAWDNSPLDGAYDLILALKLSIRLLHYNRCSTLHLNVIVAWVLQC